MRSDRQSDVLIIGFLKYFHHEIVSQKKIHLSNYENNLLSRFHMWEHL